MNSPIASRPLAAGLGLAFALGALSGCSKSETTGAAGATDAAASTSASASAKPAAAVVPDGGTLNATPVPTATVAAMVNPDGLPAYAGPTGSVEGTITVEGDPAPEVPSDFSVCPDARKTWGHLFRDGAPTGGGKARTLADAIVVVTGYKGFYVPEKNEAKEITIDGCAYTSRTVTLTFGQRLDVKNRTKDFWTPILEPGANLVMMMAAPNGDPVRIYPKKPGHWLLLDRDRKFSVVDVYAFLHPLHASSDTTGHYRIDGLPVGKVNVGVTHPYIPANAQVELDVKENVVHKVDLTLKYVKPDAGVPSMDAGITPKLR